MRWKLLIVLPFLPAGMLTGCASVRLDGHLPKYQGQAVSQLIAALGPPNQTIETGTGWSASLDRQWLYVHPWSLFSASVPTFCTVRTYVDASNVIVGSYFSGDDKCTNLVVKFRKAAASRERRLPRSC